MDTVAFSDSTSGPICLFVDRCMNKSYQIITCLLLTILAAHGMGEITLPLSGKAGISMLLLAVYLLARGERSWPFEKKSEHDKDSHS